MKYLTALLFALLLTSCSGGDKKREDFPNATQKKEKESNERLMEKSINDTTTVDSTGSRP